MPICPICGKILVCNQHAPDHELGVPTGKCPTTRPGAIWVNVKDDTGAGVPGAKLSTSKGRKTTDKSGFAGYDALPTDSYTVSLTTPSDYDPPDPNSKSADVTEGSVKVLSFQVKRRAKLKVKVVQKGDPSKVLGNADVSVRGNEKLVEGTTKSADGIADLGALTAGDYSIAVTLSTDDAKNYKVPADELKVTLAVGDVKTVPFEVTKLMWVKVRLKYKDDNSDVANAKFQLTKGDTVVNPGPLSSGLIEAKELEDGAYEVSFPEIDGAEWAPAS